MSLIRLLAVEPTVCLRRAAGGLEQLIRLRLANDAQPASARLRADGVQLTLACPHGESTHDIFIPEPARPRELMIELNGEARVTVIHPPRHWRVHLVQLSHHDVGYTDLASHVVPEHGRWLDQTLDFADATDDFPDDARFRASIEQAWSVDWYLRHADPSRADRFVDLMRRGDLELTAMFGNMTTELCDHETLVRSLYLAAGIARRHGITVRTAHHNDIPGFSWGLAEALAGAGVEMVCPGLPDYYAWGGGGLAPQWDRAAVLGSADLPGAFWWETPSGRRLLYWCSHAGASGGGDPALPHLADTLRRFEQSGYPCEIVRLPVKGANRDNSPYSLDYARTIRDWNERWVWPRLVASTNTRFWDDLRPRLPAGLPVHRGALPGQDYPPGAMSTPLASTVARRTQAALPVAEALSVVAGRPADQPRLDDAMTELLWHAEHTWGFHFPAGPAADTSRLEKALHAHRAEALVHDISRKALASLADRVRLDSDDLHLVVVNPSPVVRTDRLRHPLRELDNCGSELIPRGTTLKPVILTDRWPVHPPPQLAAGSFRLVEVESGAEVPFQLLTVDDPLAEVPHAAERLGLSAGGRRYGFFEEPAGLARDLCFIARDVPALGWRTYRLVPAPAAPPPTTPGPHLENDHFLLRITGHGLDGILDKQSNRELLSAPVRLIVVAPDGSRHDSRVVSVGPIETGEVVSRCRIELTAPGHPRVLLTVLLWNRSRFIELALHVLRDATPLLESHLAFEFDLPGGRFTQEEALAVVDPERDRLPGAFLNRLTHRDWVRLDGAGLSLHWSSLDSPVMSLAHLWPSRVSPAHSCVVGDRCREPAQQEYDLRGCSIYSLLASHNHGTNFAVAEPGATLYRYLLTSGTPLTPLAGFAKSARRPLQAIYTAHQRPRDLPPAGSTFTLDPPRARLVTLKHADAGEGVVARLWNPEPEPLDVSLRCPGKTTAQPLDLVENPLPEPPLPIEGELLRLTLPPRAVATYLLR